MACILRCGHEKKAGSSTLVKRRDIAIVGGGLAGSTAAAMLGRAGYDGVLIDPQRTFLPGFRCEKLDRSQIELSQKAGIAEIVSRSTTHFENVSVAHFGRVLDKKPDNQCGFSYGTLVNGIRAEIPKAFDFIPSKVIGVKNGTQSQTVELSSGEKISARLIILASGLNLMLRRQLGIDRKIVSKCHSISVGFDITPIERNAFDFTALTYFPERASDRIAYLTLFPIGTTMRANLFVYWNRQDTRLQQMRVEPRDTLFALMPGLRKLTGEIEVLSPISLRPVDLYVAKNYRRDGVVLVGDAYSTSCPAAGTGVNKVFTDVERLCNVHIPNWFARGAMEEKNISEFYDDKVKCLSEAYSLEKAIQLRLTSTESGATWRVKRYLKFLYHLGTGFFRSVCRTQTKERTILDGSNIIFARGRE